LRRIELRFSQLERKARVCLERRAKALEGVRRSPLCRITASANSNT